MSLHWNCFIVPLRFEICSFIAILICVTLFYSVYMQTKKKQKKKEKNNKRKEKKRKEKKRKEKKYK